MIIDAHSHVHDPVERHITLLDDAGVDRAVLFMTRPHPERATGLESLRREMAILHDRLRGQGGHADADTIAWAELDAALARWPDRFIGFGSVPLELPAGQIAAVIEREVVGRGLRGIGELTPPPGRAARIEPVLRACADQGGLPLVRDTPTMFLELSTANIIFAVRLAITEIPERTLFGSDAPYGDPLLARSTVERVTTSGEIRDRVLGATAAALFGLA